MIESINTLIDDASLVPNQILSGEPIYSKAIKKVLASAQHDIKIFDQDLSHGEFHSLETTKLLHDYLANYQNNHLTIILQNTDFLKEKCIRLMHLLSIYGHKITIYETNQTAKHAKDCFIIADNQHYIKRIHIDQARFRFCFNDENNCKLLDSRFKDLLEETESTVTITTLGL